jgi:hypothetical protein
MTRHDKVERKVVEKMRLATTTSKLMKLYKNKNQFESRN